MGNDELYRHLLAYITERCTSAAQAIEVGPPDAERVAALSAELRDAPEVATEAAGLIDMGFPQEDAVEEAIWRIADARARAERRARARPVAAARVARRFVERDPRAVEVALRHAWGQGLVTSRRGGRDRARVAAVAVEAATAYLRSLDMPLFAAPDEAAILGEAVDAA